MNKKKDSQLPERKPATASEVDAFLQAVATAPVRSGDGPGRLLFAMDATASRYPSWDRAARQQGDMFRAADQVGGIEVQLAFFRGFGEFKVAKWTPDAARMTQLMTTVDCRAGETQIAKVLAHAANETRRQAVHALIYVGDCCEEDVDTLGKLAGELGLLGVPAFMFQEGNDPIAGYAFGEIARLTGGAHCPFDAASAETLRQLLGAVAVYAAGGRKALEDHAKSTGGEALRITDQMAGKR